MKRPNYCLPTTGVEWLTLYPRPVLAQIIGNICSFVDVADDTGRRLTAVCLTSPLSPDPRGSGVDDSQNIRRAPPVSDCLAHLLRDSTTFIFKTFLNAKVTGCKVMGWWGGRRTESGWWGGGSCQAKSNHCKRHSVGPVSHDSLHSGLTADSEVGGNPHPSPPPAPPRVFPGAFIWTMCRQIYSYSGLLA